MERNEVVKEKVVSDFTNESEEKFIVVRDLTPMLKTAKFEEVKSRYGVRHPYYVTLFNDVKFEFVDDGGFYDYLISLKALGEKNFVKSKSLVEEAKILEDGTQGNTFISIKYEFSDGSIQRMFLKSFLASKSILNYFKVFEAKKNQAKQ